MTRVHGAGLCLRASESSPVNTVNKATVQKHCTTMLFSTRFVNMGPLFTDACPDYPWTWIFKTARVHPWIRPVNTSVQNDTRVYRPYSVYRPSVGLPRWLTVRMYAVLVRNQSLRQAKHNNNNNNNNEYIYIAQHKQSSDALTRATKQASFQMSGKRRHSQWRDSQMCR